MLLAPLDGATRFGQLTEAHHLADGGTTFVLQVAPLRRVET